MTSSSPAMADKSKKRGGNNAENSVQCISCTVYNGENTSKNDIAIPN